MGKTMTICTALILGSLITLLTLFAVARLPQNKANADAEKSVSTLFKDLNDLQIKDDLTQKELNATKDAIAKANTRNRVSFPLPKDTELIESLYEKAKSAGYMLYVRNEIDKLKELNKDATQTFNDFEIILDQIPKGAFKTTYQKKFNEIKTAHENKFDLIESTEKQPVE